MNGMEILRGLQVTLKHFFDTYIQDVKGGKKRYFNPEGVAQRARADTSGIFTVQYPEEKAAVPEEFRFIPFLVYEDGANGERNYRCTGCGICAKACPPQCIWITRASDPVTGKPVPSSAEFYIDVDICMNCGMCAEYCPFDAIRMDHDYEIASYDRLKHHIFDKQRLGKSAAYYASIRPTSYAQEEAIRAQKEAAKSAKKTEAGA